MEITSDSGVVPDYAHSRMCLLFVSLGTKSLSTGQCAPSRSVFIY